MAAGTIAFAFIILAVGAVAGWHARQAHGAHGDIKTYKGRIPSLRKVRLRSTLLSLGLLVLTVLAVRDLLR